MQNKKIKVIDKIKRLDEAKLFHKHKHFIEVLRKNKILVLSYILIGIFNSFMANYKADYFQRVVDGLSDRSITLAGIIIYGFILIINYCMNYADGYPEKKLEYGLFLDFKLLALRKISTIDYMEYQKIGTGRLIQRVENGAEAGKNILYDFWFCVIRQLIPTVVFSIHFIWKINRSVTYVLLLGYVFIFIITNILLKFLYQIKERILNNEERLNHYLVRGFMEMALFRIEKQFPNEIRKAEGAKRDIVSSKVKMYMIHEAFFTIFALMIAVLDIGILFFAWKYESLSVGAVVALISLIENAYIPIAIFNVRYVQYKLDRTAFAKFEDFLQLKDDGQLCGVWNNEIVNNELDGAAGRNVYEDRDADICKIYVKSLSFMYEKRRILNEINLSIKKGEKVAFVGESGCGKSTLVKILLGLLKYDKCSKGQIFLGDRELCDLCLDKLYERISYVSQEAPVFDGTIRENLVFDKKAADEDLFEALRQVGLLSLVETFEEGLDTNVGEKGTCLSGGEKQRLALARLWFKDTELVILDEATSAMDNLTEESVMHEVMQKLEKQTVIAIAHRLSSIADFDRIVLFNNGEIVGQGSFDELLHSNSYFEELCMRTDVSKESRDMYNLR